MKDTGVIAMSSPEFRQSAQQIAVQIKPAFGRRARPQQFVVDSLGDQRGRTVAV